MTLALLKFEVVLASVESLFLVSSFDEGMLADRKGRGCVTFDQASCLVLGVICVPNAQWGVCSECACGINGDW